MPVIIAGEVIDDNDPRAIEYRRRKNSSNSNNNNQNNNNNNYNQRSQPNVRQLYANNNQNNQNNNRNYGTSNTGGGPGVNLFDRIAIALGIHGRYVQIPPLFGYNAVNVPYIAILVIAIVGLMFGLQSMLIAIVIFLLYQYSHQQR